MSKKPDAFEKVAREIYDEVPAFPRLAAQKKLASVLHQHFPDVPRVLAWLRSSPRKPAILAFTAGPDRDLAAELEWELRYAQYAGCEDDAVAKEFCDWLSDRLPYTVFPSTEAVQLDVKEALIRILRKHFQPPASEPSGIDLPDSEGVWVDKHGKKWWVECTRVLKEPMSALRLETPLLGRTPIAIIRLERGGWHRAVSFSEVESLRSELAAAKARIAELEAGSSCRPLALNPLATGGVG